MTIHPRLLNKHGGLANDPTGYGRPVPQPADFNTPYEFKMAWRERHKLQKQAAQNGVHTPRRHGVRKATKVFATPLAKAHGLQVIAMAKLEDALIMTAQERGLTPEMEKGFALYQKLKTLGLADTHGAENEARSALRMATIQLVKLVF